MFHAELSQKDHFPVLSALREQAGKLLIDMAASSGKPGRVRSGDQIRTTASACWALAHGMSELIISEQLPPALLSNPNRLSQRIHGVIDLLLFGLCG